MPKSVQRRNEMIRHENDRRAQARQRTASQTRPVAFDRSNKLTVEERRRSRRKMQHASRKANQRFARR